MAAPRPTAAPVGSSETAPGSTPACQADATGAAPGRSADVVGPAGAADRSVSPACATPVSLANPTAATAPGLLASATAESSAGTGVRPTPCPA